MTEPIPALDLPTSIHRLFKKNCERIIQILTMLVTNSVLIVKHFMASDNQDSACPVAWR
jgi:hypothetical protein